MLCTNAAMYYNREEVSEYRVGEETQPVTPFQQQEKKSVKKVCVLHCVCHGSQTPDAGAVLLLSCSARCSGCQLVIKISALFQENPSNLVHYSQ